MSDVKNIVGLDDLQRYFKEFPAEVSKKVLRKMAGAGAQVVRAATSDKIPIGKSTPRHVAGTLKRSLRVVYKREDSNDNQAVFAVTFRQGKKAQGKVVINRKSGAQSFQLSADAYYAGWVERGHRIVGRRNANFLRGSTIRARRTAANVSGARVPPHPFLEPAFVGSRQTAEDAMVETGQALVKDML